MAKEVNYSKAELESILKGYIEQRGLLVQSLERLEGAIIAVNNLLNPQPKEKPSKPEKEVVKESETKI